jgi:hypothetical protein
LLQHLADRLTSSHDSGLKAALARGHVRRACREARCVSDVRGGVAAHVDACGGPVPERLRGGNTALEVLLAPIIFE